MHTLKRLADRPWLLNLLLGTGVLLAAITAAASLWRPPVAPLPRMDEQFDPMLAGLSSVDEIMFVLATANPGATPLQQLDAADALLRRRFIHSYSYFKTDQNWAAAMLRPVWDNLASPVQPDDILRHRRAACSQQSLVFLEIARRLGFPYAAVRAPDHFLAAVQLDGQWWVYDANREVGARRYPYQWLKNGDARIATLYKPAFATQLLAGARSDRIGLISINRFAAPQARLLHQATDLFSRYGWLVVLTLWAALRCAAPGNRSAPIAQAEARNPA